MNIDEAMELVEKIKEKLSPVKGLPDKITLGVAARNIEGKDELMSKGLCLGSGYVFRESCLLR